VFFSSWQNVGQVVLAAVCVYLGLVVILRASGKRTLAALNSFDFIVTVALGSTVSTVILPSKPALVDGLVALAMLVGLQYAMAWSNVRSRTVTRLLKGEPTLLMRRGRMLDAAMRAERVDASDLLNALREQGVADVESVEAVILETNGDLTVIPASGASGKPTTLGDVREGME
jgi:uncharacterized membrane protein YcaP (DUF421 family)